MKIMHSNANQDGQSCRVSNMEPIDSQDRAGASQCRVLVTGGAGFIGRHVLTRLKSLGFKTYCVDLRPCPVSVSGESKVVNLLDFNSLQEFVKTVAPHYIMHLSALARIEGERDEMFAANVTATENLMKAIPRSVTKVVFASTQLVVRMGDDPRDGEYFNPYTYYAETKAEMERRVRASSPVDWLIVRPTTIWGPYHPSFSVGLYKYIKMGLYLHPNTKDPIIRSYGYVENAADQLVELLLNDAVKARVLYISDFPIDSGEFLDQFSQALRGAKIRRVHPEFLSALGRAGDLLHKGGIPFPLGSDRVLRMTSSYVVPIQDTIKLVGSPKISIAEGVRRTIKWMDMNNQK